jgi:hypothetical protein
MNNDLNPTTTPVSPFVSYSAIILLVLIAAGGLYYALQYTGIVQPVPLLPAFSTTNTTGTNTTGGTVNSTASTHTTTTINPATTVTTSLSISAVSTEVKIVSSSRSDTPAEALIGWKTSRNAKAAILWGTSAGALTNTQAVVGGTMSQSFDLKGLPRRTMIYYQVVATADDDGAVVKSPIGSFMVN